MGVSHAHLLERCILWVFPCTSILKMCTLGLSLHICLKDVYSGSFPEHVLKTCNLCVSLHTCLKDAYSGCSFHFTHSHSKNNLGAQTQTHQTGCIQLIVPFLSCCCPVCWVTSVKAATFSSGLAYFRGILS